MILKITCFSLVLQWNKLHIFVESKKISNDQELIQSDAISCPQNQMENN